MSTTPIPSPPPGLTSNPEESRQGNIIACAIVTWIISFLLVGLRFYTRRWIIHALGAEDWVILASLLFSGLNSAGSIEQAIYGMGKHALDVDPAVYIPMRRSAYLTIIWYMMTLALTKISILLLYIRILTYQHACYAAYTIMAIVVVSNIWTCYTTLTACIPLQAFWDYTIQGAYCRPVSYWWANTGMHMVSDFLIFLLPMPIIFNLKAPLRQKLTMYSVFAFGFFACLASVFRLIPLLKEFDYPDFTWDNVTISYWTCIEVNTAIACACVMTLRPLMTKMFPKLMTTRADSGETYPQEASTRSRPLTIGSRPSRLPTGDSVGDSWMILQGRGPGRDPAATAEDEPKLLLLKNLGSSSHPGSPAPQLSPAGTHTTRSGPAPLSAGSFSSIDGPEIRQDSEK